MTHVEYLQALAELEELLNDPQASLDPARVWQLTAELAAFCHASDSCPVARDIGRDQPTQKAPAEAISSTRSGFAMPVIGCAVLTKSSPVLAAA